MVKTVDATTTDRLRCSPLYFDLSPSCARKRACMELTTICRFQRLLNPSFRLFQCSRQRHVPTLWRYRHLLPTNNSLFHQGFFAVKRREVFILGAMSWALERGWRRDCVVSGMETRFQWRKAHSRTAKCEAFHVAPRLFFMFLFLITFTIRQQCIIYTQDFPTEMIQ